IRPACWRIIVGATACVHAKTPRRSTEMTASNSASLIMPVISSPFAFTSCPSRRMPALFTSTSMRPWSLATAAAAFAAAATSVTSTRVSAPSATSHVTTVAPASRNTRAVSAPIPRAPPVTIAIFPSSRNITYPSLRVLPPTPRPIAARSRRSPARVPAARPPRPDHCAARAASCESNRGSHRRRLRSRHRGRPRRTRPRRGRPPGRARGSCPAPSGRGSRVRLPRAHPIPSGDRVDTGREAADDELLDLRRALVEPVHARISPVALDRELVGEAVTAVDLDGAVGRALRGLGRVELGDARLTRVRASLVLEVAGAPHEEPRGLGLDDHVGDQLLDELMSRDRLSERFARRRVLDRRIDAGLRDADRAGCDRVTPRVERGHRDLEAVADLTEAVRVGDTDVVENELARIR